MRQTFWPGSVYINIYIIIRYWMAVWFCLSVCLSVRSLLETTFPFSNFKTKHIFEILMTLRKFSKLWGACGAQFFFSSTAAEGTDPLEGERNPAEGGCFVSIYIYICMQSIWTPLVRRFSPAVASNSDVFLNCVYMRLFPVRLPWRFIKVFSIKTYRNCTVYIVWIASRL